MKVWFDQFSCKLRKWFGLQKCKIGEKNGNNSMRVASGFAGLFTCIVYYLCLDVLSICLKMRIMIECRFKTLN